MDDVWSETTFRFRESEACGAVEAADACTADRLEVRRVETSEAAAARASVATFFVFFFREVAACSCCAFMRSARKDEYLREVLR